MKIYEKVDGANWRNIWVVGDLHGCYTNLMNRLDTVGFDPAQDLLISVGDLIDRGTENVECLDLINQPWFRAVRGNHEQMMLDGLADNGNVNHWMANGGSWFLYLDYEQEVLAKALLYKVAELPLIIEVTKGGKKFVICHADYPGREYEFGKPVDHDQPCISCGETNPPDLHGGQWDCGHFKTVGGFPELRFEERNAYRQCKSCNAGSAKHGAKAATVAQQYEATLVERFGQELVDWLNGPHEMTRYRRDDFIRIRDDYRRKCREMEKKPEAA